MYRASRILVWLVYAFAVSAILFLTTAFFLKLFNANESAPFVQWVDRATTILMQPFRGIFPAVQAENGSVFDASLFFAILMYWFLAVGMHALLGWIDRRIVAAAYHEDQARAAAVAYRPLESQTPAVSAPPGPYATPPSVERTAR